MSAAVASGARVGAFEFAQAVAVGGERLVRFQSGGQAYALPLDRVAEVVALGSATATAPRGWIGTLARNGRPVPIGDLAFLLGVAAPMVSRRELRAVIMRGALPYGMTVESVPTVQPLGDARPEPLPPLARRGAASLIASSLIQGDELLLLLDPDAIGERLASGIVRDAEGRVSELRSLQRRPTGDTDRFAQVAARASVPEKLRRDTPALLLGGVEASDGGAGVVPAIPMAWIQEVRSLQPVRPMPHAPAGLVGVIAWRGRCLPVIDLAQRLTGIPSAEGTGRRLLIVGPQRGDALGAMIVPGVRGLATLAPPPTGVAAPSDTLAPALLDAWTRHGDDAVALLDPRGCFI